MSFLNKIRVIFIGTPDFAIPSLQVLIKDDFFDIVGVVTQPDRPVGRKQIFTPPLVKIESQKHDILVFQPEKISDFSSQIADLKPDLIVVVAYSQIIPKSILNIPKYGCVNVHGSILPKYRGASCIQAAILNGDEETGATIIKMDTGLDTGPILAQTSIRIENNWTAGVLYDKVSLLGAEILSKTLKKYIKGEIHPAVQDNAKASYVPKLKKEDAKIDWSGDAEYIVRFVRAMSPWPGAYAQCTMHSNQFLIKKIKIIEVDIKILNINKYSIGEVFSYDEKFAVQCGANALIVKKLQLEGKKEIYSKSFLQGNAKIVGTILNNN